ncbi:MAG: SoxR reducing system RseC family protein [Zoogloeaceae bacterium]|jgi:sigma-E factor negative regulatory protein RseC|nr:SoxR reducing system RseC family protein [Zoogloeaceae bacterium]
MMEQEAIVARVEGGHACVEIGSGGGCGHCHEAGGCQSGILGRIFRNKPRQFRLPNHIGAMPGERVIVRVDEGATLRAALLTYLLPALCLLLGAAAGAALNGGGDAGAALGALAGFALRRTARFAAVAEPALIRCDAARRDPSFRVLKETCR